MTKTLMELDEFVAKVLLDIDKGIQKTKQEISNVLSVKTTSTEIEFDIAVTVSSDDKKGLGITVASVLKAGGEVSATSQSTSRIKFKIPVYFSPKINQNNINVKSGKSPVYR